MLHPFDLSNKTALVTGASRGLGFEMAKALGLAGATVFLNARSKTDLQTACNALEKLDIKVSPLAFDITDEAALKAAFTQISHLDILVNNAGMRDRRFIHEFDLQDARSLFESNLISPFNLARHAALKMGKTGRIINITSIAGHIARAGDALYTASKAGLSGLTKAMAAELGPQGITVNAIAPGFFATKANQELVDDPEICTFLEKRTAIGRWGQPEEIGGACVFLASDAASYITGQSLIIDGGMNTHF